MKKIAAIICMAVTAACLFFGNAYAADNFLILCYHDIPAKVERDDYGVERALFVQQIEYLRTHGYHFISLEDARKAGRGEKTLPKKAVLLTFDDGYASFYEFVYPLLKLYGYPGVLAVVTSWIDNPPKDIKNRFMNWEQLREVAQGGLVEVASHSHDHHRTIVYNVQGNQGRAMANREYDPRMKIYESEEAYRARVHADMSASKNLLQEKTGIPARAIVWPYGKYSGISRDEAKKIGFDSMLTLGDEWASVKHLDALPRYIVVKNPDMPEFIQEVTRFGREIEQQRILQADIDLIYNEDPQQQQKNIDAFIERVFTMKVNTVYLQAFSDDAGDGNIASVYFPNRVLPVKADLFSYIVNQLVIRDIQVYAWMPMLSISLPNKEENDRLRVREMRDGEKKLSTSWYARLSPFSSEARQYLWMLYEDMAAHARIDGVVFQDDGYLNDFEDFSSFGSDEYLKICGGEWKPCEKLSAEEKSAWTGKKTAALIAVTDELKKAVRKYRPEAKFARTLYAPVLSDPRSEEWFAQNYDESVKAYDYAVVMAYPYLEEVRRPLPWLKELVKKAEKNPDGLKKTVFKVQAYDWKKNKWVDTRTLDKWLRVLVARGALHIAYYPDDFNQDKPDERVIRLMMSTEDFPFKRQKVK